MAQLTHLKSAPFSEEDVCMISKEAPCAIWAGTKILYSGCPLSGPGNSTQASGYNFYSGESDIAPITLSGWGEIRVPELNQLHKIFVFPKDPTYIARSSYRNLTLGTTSGLPGGDGGCSGKVALLEWIYLCSGPCSRVSGGDYVTAGGIFTSGVVDVIAFGSQY